MHWISVKSVVAVHKHKRTHIDAQYQASDKTLILLKPIFYLIAWISV